MKLMLHAATIYRAINPAQQFKIEARLPETSESDTWCRFPADFIVVAGDALEAGNDGVNVRTVRDADGDTNSVSLRRPAGFIDDLGIADHAVRNCDFDVVAGQ